jgi:hypothetical protein
VYSGFKVRGARWRHTDQTTVDTISISPAQSSQCLLYGNAFAACRMGIARHCTGRRGVGALGRECFLFATSSAVARSLSNRAVLGLVAVIPARRSSAPKMLGEL